MQFRDFTAFSNELDAFAVPSISLHYWEEKIKQSPLYRSHVHVCVFYRVGEILVDNWLCYLIISKNYFREVILTSNILVSIILYLKNILLKIEQINLFMHSLF